MTTKEEKARRMQIRKETGTRVIEPPVSPPYNRGPKYLSPHACFECCVSFKIEPYLSSRKCQNCEGELYNMGRAFKAPKRTNTEQWKKVKKLYLAGYRFPMTSTKAPAYPEKLREVDNFIAENPAHPFRSRMFINL